MDTSWRPRSTFNDRAPQSLPQSTYSSLFPRSQPQMKPMSNTMGRGPTALYGSQSTLLSSGPQTAAGFPTAANLKSQTLYQWVIEYFITRNFIGCSLLTQSVVTLLISLMAYCLWNSSTKTHSVKLYLFYKVTVIALMALMVYFLSLMLSGKSSNSATTPSVPHRGLYPMANPSMNDPIPPVISSFGAQSRNSNNPYTSSFGGSLGRSGPLGSSFGGPSSLNSLNSISENDPFKKSGSLFFTEKQMADRHLSTAVNAVRTESKFDFNASPKRSAALNPGHIADTKTLNNFIKKQHDQRSKPRMPSSASTPIGKTFAMRMTPSALQFQSPTKSMINNSNQGSVMLQTPSSAMDVTMDSFHHDVDEPFNADFSAIEPSPAATAWNVSTTAFGGHSAPMDMSTIAQPGTPAKGLSNGGGGYSYDSMYNDINLGDKMGQVLRERTEPQRMLPQANLNEKRSAVPPQSPYSRRRKERNTAPKSSAMDLMAAKSKFTAKLMERSIECYRKLRIDGLIANWAQDMKWWMGESVMERRWREIMMNDKQIEQLFNLLRSKYDNSGALKEQLKQLQTLWSRIFFVQSNTSQLEGVARVESQFASHIMHIAQRTQHIAECIGFLMKHFERFNENNQATDYCIERIKQLQSTRSLTLYKWNGGDDKEWQPMGLPTDAELLMGLFCRYMDDALCPAIKFSERHFVEISAKNMDELEVIKDVQRVKDVAICCVSAHKIKDKKLKDKKRLFSDQRKEEVVGASNDNLPYYFVVWNRKKYGTKMEQMMKAQRGRGGATSRSAMFGAIKKPKAFLAQSWSSGVKAPNDSFDHYMGNNKGDDDEEEQWRKPKNQKSNRSGGNVEAWFAEPGTNNVFHAVTLFALFIQKCCDGKLGGISLRDQRCNLLEAISN